MLYSRLVFGLLPSSFILCNPILLQILKKKITIAECSVADFWSTIPNRNSASATTTTTTAASTTTVTGDNITTAAASSYHQHNQPPPRRLKKKYDRVHSGPIAILYRTVRVCWQDRLILQITGNKASVNRMTNNGSSVMAAIFPLSSVGRSGDDSVRIIVSIDDEGRLTVQQQPIGDRLERTVELQVPAFNLTAAVTFSDAVFNQRQQLPFETVDDSTELRPWIEFLSLPFNDDIQENSNAAQGGVMVSSGLLGSLRHLSSPDCWNMFCLTAVVCGPTAVYCCPHLLGRITALEAAAVANGSLLVDYPAEYTANFVTFSRQFICPAATPAYSSGCLPGWRRHNYRCYQLFVDHQQRPVTYQQAVSACRSHGAKLVIFAPRELISSTNNNKQHTNFFEDELAFVLGLLLEVTDRIQRKRKNNEELYHSSSSSSYHPEGSAAAVWVGGRNGFSEPCLRIDPNGSFVSAAASASLAECVPDEGAGYMCQTNGCEGGERHCCRLTWAEHLRWERRVLGKAFILRPSHNNGNSSSNSRLSFEQSLTLNLAHWVIGGAIAFVVVYRIVTRDLEERRYTARSLTKY